MMSKLKLALLLGALLATGAASAQEPTALSCSDFRPTEEALERFPNLIGACEGIVERDGELFGLFRGEVRRVRGSQMTVYLPSTDKTFTIRPDASTRVIVDGRKVRPTDLATGSEFRIYLSVNEFAKPDIEEVAFVTEEDVLIQVAVASAPVLPTTASSWPAVALGGLLLLGSGYLLRRRRVRIDASLAVLLSIALIASAPSAKADDHEKTIDIPARVVTSTVKTAAIVEAVNKETREIKVIDASGRRYSFIASDMVANFDQIEPRDRIVTEYIESVAVAIAPAGAPELGDAAAIELAPLGDKPSVKGADTFMVRATIEAVDEKNRTALLRGENGRARTVQVPDDVPMEIVKVGDEVRMRITEAIAISVVHPDKS
jgi:LPXTG-motif cell wall-anchored protein